MAEEQVFLESNGLFVSTSRIVIKGTTYATSNVTSVTKRVTAPSTGCSILLFIFGAIFLVGAFATPNSGAMVMVLLTGAAMMFGGYKWFASLKPTHHVVLSSSSGETDALSSVDEATINQVITAINNAIVSRG